MRLTKREKEHLSRQYAEGLYLSRMTNPADLPDLKKRRDWQEADEYEKRRIVSELATLARDELLRAGHNRETVHRLVNDYIRHW